MEEQPGTILNDYLWSTYTDPKNPGSFSSVENLYREAKKAGKKVTKRQVKKFLEGTRTYTVHKKRN